MHFQLAITHPEDYWVNIFLHDALEFLLRFIQCHLPIAVDLFRHCYFSIMFIVFFPYMN